jgi:hypothetical protein
MKTLLILVAIAALIAIVKTPQDLLNLTGSEYAPRAPVEMPA